MTKYIKSKDIPVKRIAVGSGPGRISSTLSGITRSSTLVDSQIKIIIDESNNLSLSSFSLDVFID